MYIIPLSSIVVTTFLRVHGPLIRMKIEIWAKTQQMAGKLYICRSKISFLFLSVPFDENFTGYILIIIIQNIRAVRMFFSQ